MSYRVGVTHPSCSIAMWAGTFTTLPEGDLCPHSLADNIPKFRDTASGKVYLGTVRLFFTRLTQQPQLWVGRMVLTQSPF